MNFGEEGGKRERERERDVYIFGKRKRKEKAGKVREGEKEKRDISTAFTSFLFYLFLHYSKEQRSRLSSS